MPRIKPMKPGHPDYDSFQRQVQELTRFGFGYRMTAAEYLGAIGHPEGIVQLTRPGQGIYDQEPHVCEKAGIALGAIAEKIKQKQPEHPAVIARQHIDPAVTPKAFIALYNALTNGEHIGQPPAWLTTYAKQLKALEGNLK